MPDRGAVWIGRTLRHDEESGVSLVLVRGVFLEERSARDVAEAFGCDALMFSSQGQPVELGQVVVVNVKKTPVVEE